jgi:tetratricopeptide (TPR) repeat protein
MKKFILLVVATFLSGTTILSAQNQDYLKAETLAKEANEQLKQGEVKKADALINESIELYPTRAIFEYAKSLCRLSDVTAANTIMDKAYEKVKVFSSPFIFLYAPSPGIAGANVFAVNEYEKSRALYYFGGDAYLVNKEFGDKKEKEKILERLVNLKLTKNTTVDYDLEYNNIANWEMDLAMLQEDFDKAVDIIKNKPTSIYNPEWVNDLMLTFILIEKGDYPKALEYAETFKGIYKSAKYTQKFYIYALMGNNKEALINYNEYKAIYKKLGLSNMVLNLEFYYLALIDLNKKDYKSALINLDSTLNYRGTWGPKAEGMLVDRWKVYKLVGDAYTGLQLFEKANDNYTISLLSNPDYEPTIKAIANLQSIIASETFTDKTLPLISLLSPVQKRGAKMFNKGANILIKGFAKDISGIKEVSINNKIVYSQKGGDFWGEISLTDGINKITIKAIDFADNMAELIFEIERQTGTTNTSAQIEPTPEKEGRNYCLLIAAQNYSDNNISSLSNPVADAVKLKLVFKNYYNFAEENIITLFNPETNDVLRQLLELANKLQPEDNLIIFYAGHGIWVDKEKKGYWLLTNSKLNDVNTWLSNKTVLDLIAKIPSRHTLLISDACFSGSVFKTRGLSDATVAIKEMDKKISRVAITSGNDTEVPDESVFLKCLLKALTENKEKNLTAQKMFITQIIETVMTETKTEPRYGTLEMAGHIGGDYIFNKK